MSPLRSLGPSCVFVLASTVVASLGCGGDPVEDASADSTPTLDAGGGTSDSGEVLQPDAAPDTPGQREEVGSPDAAEGEVGSAGPHDAGSEFEGDPLPGVFVQPVLECRPPLPGEPPPADGDEVCTWSTISACTEEGRRFADYASCDVVVTQRPYFGFPVEEPETDGDPRLDDDAYLAELAWVREQVEACACTCCHSDRDAPRGPSGWKVEAGPLWIDTVPDSGLAMLAGLVESSAFGAYPASENYGFDRSVTGLPTNDVPRMQTFLVEEYLRRGYSIEDAERYPAFGGPLVAQAAYEPRECGRGDGLDGDAIVWPSGQARYVYVLREGSANPGVPPNRDLPEGTLWRIDVPASGLPLSSGVEYGRVPEGARQRFPEEGPPEALEPGERYLVYVLADVGFPLLRCLSTY